MAVDVRMPKLSDNMESGLIIRWMKAPGDTVTKGEALAEVETDKADVELEAAESGVLREITVAEGQSAAVGAVIAVLAAAGDGDGASASGAAKPPVGARPGAPAAAKARSADAEEAVDVPDEAAPGSAETARDEPPRRAAAPPAKPRPAAKPTAVAKPSAAAKPAAAARPAPRQQSNHDAQSAVRASPLAWRLAEDNGIDLTTVRGSGPGGRILQRDVEALVEAPPAPVEASAADAPDSEAPRSAAGTRLVPASRMRQAIARRMSDAKRDIPHFYVTAEVDMTEAMHLRESIKRREAMPGLTVTHLLVRALAVALVRHPNVNGSWRDGAIELHDDVNIGIAVAVDDGLVVPVLHRAQTLSLGEIAARAGELTERARQNRFSGDDLSGSTFSISNVGMLDIEELTAVINPPNAAILAVGAVKERPIVRAGQLAVAQTMRATLSCDHRVLNGLEGGRFLEELKSILENPVTLLLE